MENAAQAMMVCVACGSKKISFFAEKNKHQLQRCMSCGHVFIFPFSQSTEQLYGEDYFSGSEKGFGYVDYDKDKEPMRHIFVAYMERIEKILGHKGKLLDVGAATGYFVEVAQSMGWEASGIEISKFAADIAHRKGLNVQCGTLHEGRFAEASFDVITMWDVFEHFVDPSIDVHIATTLLKDGGVLAINTPDVSSLYARIMGKRWHLIIPPEHIHYFSKRSAAALLERNGFCVEEMTTIGKTFTLEYIFHIIAMWRNSRIARLVVKFLKAHPRLGGISLPINLRDNMFILARKRNA